MAVQNFGSGGGGFQVSPGVNISEVDLTTVVPSVSTTVGAFAGIFRWGPVGQRILVSSENDLVTNFGRPNDNNAESWFSAANFLAYSNALYVVRAAANNTFAAIANTSAFDANSAHTIRNFDDYAVKSASFNSAVAFIAKWPGDKGSSLRVSVCDSANQFNSTVDLVFANSTVNSSSSSTLTIPVGSKTANVYLANGGGWSPATEAVANVVMNDLVKSKLSVGDYVDVGNNSIGRQSLKIVSISNTAGVYSGATFLGGTYFNITFDQPYKLSADASSTSIVRYWEYFNQVGLAPGQSQFTAAKNSNTAAFDEMHVVVVDERGAFTSNPGTVLEVFQRVSRATDAKANDGTSNYYKTVLNNTSSFIWVATERGGASYSNTAVNITAQSGSIPLSVNFQGGVDQSEVNGASIDDIARAWDMFASPEEVDVSLLIAGKTQAGTNGTQIANYIIDNVANVRKDCIAFISPTKEDVVNAGIGTGDNVVEFRNSLRSTSFAVLDSGYKYQYDKYNDVYRWVPLNGDVAGLCVRTDSERDPWFSPAGTARGQIKNVIKLAWNPTKAYRDLLYKNGVNPVITQAGQGTILFGDKTLQDKPSAFDHINVRRLFIILEKAIANAAKSFMFEFNDEFTRTQFRNVVEPFLRDVQGRRGIYDFKVVCDDSNNTPEVIDASRFVGDVYIKPARSINYIQLNFVAVRSGIEFSEIVG